MIKLNDIKGLLVDNKEDIINKMVDICNSRYEDCKRKGVSRERIGMDDFLKPVFDKIYEQCIAEQGERSIGLNREKLARMLHAQERKTFGFGYEWENEKVIVRNQWLEMADAIIAAEADLIEVKE